MAEERELPTDSTPTGCAKRCHLVLHERPPSCAQAVLRSGACASPGVAPIKHARLGTAEATRRGILIIAVLKGFAEQLYFGVALLPCQLRIAHLARGAHVYPFCVHGQIRDVRFADVLLAHELARLLLEARGAAHGLVVEAEAPGPLRAQVGTLLNGGDVNNVLVIAAGVLLLARLAGGGASAPALASVLSVQLVADGTLGDLSRVLRVGQIPRLGGRSPRRVGRVGRLVRAARRSADSARRLVDLVFHGAHQDRGPDRVISF
mmetsp:Transcript_101459/g.272837  ORF Transcript_101459/g.272837 Transcript_101459/m.272837 type:complete len:263 (-) Transcript_101459:701-1489(-)